MCHSRALVRIIHVGDAISMWNKVCCVVDQYQDNPGILRPRPVCRSGILFFRCPDRFADTSWTYSNSSQATYEPAAEAWIMCYFRIGVPVSETLVEMTKYSIENDPQQQPLYESCL